MKQSSTFFYFFIQKLIKHLQGQPLQGVTRDLDFSAPPWFCEGRHIDSSGPQAVCREHRSSTAGV